VAHLSPQALLAHLDALGISTDTVEHPAVFTVAESRPVKAAIPGAHSKNLFVKDKKGRYFLITARDETASDLFPIIRRTYDVVQCVNRCVAGNCGPKRQRQHRPARKIPKPEQCSKTGHCNIEDAVGGA